MYSNPSLNIYFSCQASNMIYVLINRNKRLLINHNLSWDLNQCTTCTRRNVRKEEGRLSEAKRQRGTGVSELGGRGAIVPRYWQEQKQNLLLPKVLNLYFPPEFQIFLRPWGEGGKGEERGRPLNGCYGISQDFSWGPPAIFVCACILHAAAQTPLAPLY